MENIPRLLENWNGTAKIEATATTAETAAVPAKQFIYNGSMIALFKSQQATGQWNDQQRDYKAPTRIWRFEPLFLTNPPPGTFVTTSYLRHRWYHEEIKG